MTAKELEKNINKMSTEDKKKLLNFYNVIIKFYIRNQKSLKAINEKNFTTSVIDCLSQMESLVYSLKGDSLITDLDLGGYAIQLGLLDYSEW